MIKPTFVLSYIIELEIASASKWKVSLVENTEANHDKTQQSGNSMWLCDAIWQQHQGKHWLR